MRSQFNLETAVTVRAVRASAPITSQLPIFPRTFSASAAAVAAAKQ